MTNSKLAKWVGFWLVVLLINTAYIGAFANPTVFYMGNVLFHLGLGTAIAIAVLILLLRQKELMRGAGPAALFFLISAFIGGYLAWAGNLRPNRGILWAHIITAGLGVLALVPYLFRQASEKGGGWRTLRHSYMGALLVLVLLPASTALYQRMKPNPHDKITNPLTAPLTMEEEGEGPQSPFFPSPAKTDIGGIIPANFFMDSKRCGECHKDVYEQFQSSAHHFASFNNQFYRKSIEYMQDVAGVKASRWCAGCHDHAVFFNGRFEKPIREQIDTPEAQNGLACTSCHSIIHVEHTMGNGAFTIEYPALHELASSKNKYIRALDNFLINLNPEPHRRTFIKPFMRGESLPDYCTSCHKVHLDKPVNDWRWLRGFNDYDSWQASGVSGQGARSFYYPAKTSTCGDCHMPLVDSKDPGNINGKVHSHRFAAANTALAMVNGDHTQLSEVEKFLKSGFISVDIFSVSPVEEKETDMKMLRRAGEGPQLSTTLGVGEEGDSSGTLVLREVGKMAAPIDKSGVKLVPGSTARVDVVVRTRKIGHLFPGGTVDGFDVWLELQGRDADGKVIFWSGQVTENGKGPVEPGAHFYKSYLLDAEGNPINKRNAWQARSVLYVRLIPPGSADVAHYRIKIPKDAKGPITLTAKLNHRKFAWYYTQFAYAGVPKEGQDPALLGRDHNSLEYSFDVANIPANVSGIFKKEIPNLPITVLAQAETKIPLGETTNWTPVVNKEDRERWNDWGIGLLLQGDLKGAEYAFKRVTEAEPGYADGWVNVARALAQEGETDEAKPFVAKALSISPNLGRAHFFKAMVEKADGDYDAAIASLKIVEGLYPRDRVVLNQLARMLFLKREYAEALKVLERVSLVDPEDLQMHYTAMLCYRGLGDSEQTAREQKLFQRFKAEESSQAITGKRRLVSPEDNNERQQIHDHESVTLGAVAAAGSPARAVAHNRAMGGSEPSTHAGGKK